MKKSLALFFGFIVAGGSATLVNYSLFAALYWLGVNYLVASTVGYVSGIIVSFTINRLVVFKNTATRPHQLTRYTLIYLGALAVQLGLLESGVRLGFDPFVANAIALVIVVVGNFFVIRRFVFFGNTDHPPH
jgi:putative flippase GtrA